MNLEHMIIFSTDLKMEEVFNSTGLFGCMLRNHSDICEQILMIIFVGNGVRQ